MENEIIQSTKENMLMTIPQEQALAMYATASSLKLTPEENKALLELFADEDIEIRPDGHIYLPQSKYRNRLNQALGIGQWGLIAKGSTQQVEKDPATGQDKKIKMLLNGILVIRSCFIAEAVGEAELHLSNENQSLGTVWEAAKSDCITRCCKDLSIGQQVYDPTYIRSWQEKYAVRVWIQGKQKPHWRKKDVTPFFNEVGPVDGIHAYPSAHPSEQRDWLNKNHTAARGGGITSDWTAAVQGLTDGTLTMDQLNATYKINRDLKEELMAIVKASPKPKQQTPGSEPLKITGDVIAKLEKCRNWLEVDDLAKQYKEQIVGNQNWREAFMATKKQLPPVKMEKPKS
jgi:hypothetical protein